MTIPQRVCAVCPPNLLNKFVQIKDFDQIVDEVSQKLEILDTRISENFETLLQKADKSEIGILTSDKVRKDELQSYLPDMDILEARLLNMVKAHLEEAAGKQVVAIRNWD